MNTQRILVISSANIDFVQRMRRMPYSGETVIENELNYAYIPGGKGANSAIAFARFGADTVFACKLGRDANAKRLRAIYEREGIDTRYILEDADTPTGLASILVEDNGKNRIIVYPGANMTMTPDDIEESFNCYPDAVYMQLEIPDEAVLEAARRANEAGIPLFIDAGPARLDFPLNKLGKVEVFSPNESECRIFTGITPNSDESCLRAAIKLSSIIDAKYIVIKLGGRGAFVYDGKFSHIVPTIPVNVVDTTAAGDTFTAALVHFYLQGMDILDATHMGHCAAAIGVSRPGAYTSIPTKEEVLAFAEAHPRR